MPQATINGVRINYLQAGEGPDLVMVHGLTADLSFWYLRILPHLKDRWRVTVYDQRGHGYSDAPRSGYSTRDLAGDLIGLMDHLGIERPHLVGHSFGGAVLLHHAVLHPDRARSLALVDTRVHALQPIPAFDDEPFWERRRERLASQGVRVPADTPRVFYMLLEELVLLEGNGAAEKQVPHGLIPWRAGSRMDRRVRKLLLESTLARDVREVAGLTAEAIGGVTLPALLSYGELSQCLKTCRALEKRLPDHRTVIHPRLGHFFPTARPELIVDDLRGFLEETERARSRRTGG
jgi:pimeloyl-ACP methyl ester carboxylesterase